MKLLTIKNFKGLNTVKRNLPPHQAREIQDLVSERGLTKTRSGFGKYNVLAQSGAILGIFDYRRKNGQKGYLFCDANGDIYEWEQFHFGSGWVWNPDTKEWEWEDGGDNFWWTTMYEATKIPGEADPSWTVVSETSASVSNGILTLWSGEYRRNNAVASNSVGNIIQARFKIGEGINPGSLSNLQIWDGSRVATMEMGPSDSDVVVILGGSGYTIVGGMDEYHTYTLTSKGTALKGYIDGVLRMSTVNESGSALNRFSFEGLYAYTYWDYVRYYTGGF